MAKQLNATQKLLVSMIDTGHVITRYNFVNIWVSWLETLVFCGHNEYYKTLRSHKCWLESKRMFYNIINIGAPSKPVCRDFGLVCLQIDSKEFQKLG